MQDFDCLLFDYVCECIYRVGSITLLPRTMLLFHLKISIDFTNILFMHMYSHAVVVCY